MVRPSRAKLAEQLINKQQQAPAPSTDPARGILAGLQRGFGQGIGGILTGQDRLAPPADESLLEHLAALGGQVVSDIPGMILGGEAGAALGSPAGPVGSVIGASAGAFSLPTLLNQAYNEYLDVAKSDKGLTFGDFLERAGRVGVETGKSATVGAVAGQLGRFTPILKNLPGFGKLLSTRAGTKAAEVALETAGITGAQSILEGELPSLQNVADIAAISTGAKLARPAAKGVRRGIEAIPYGAETIQAAEGMLKNAAQKGYEKAGMVTPQPLKDIWTQVKSLKGNKQQEKLFEILKDTIGERNARTIESQFDWRERLASAEQSGKFTPENFEDMIYYRQKTGNPRIKGDSFETLKKRLPKHGKEFVDYVVDKHLKDSLKAWNDHPLTKDINPREALQDNYLPGLYEYDPERFARAYDEVSKKFKNKNPFSNPKTFLNYAEAFEQAGLKPRYKNIVELMRAYDEVMNRSLASVELLDKIQQYEKANKIKLFTNSRNRKAYEQAKKEGWIPFDDPFLRRYVAGTKPTRAPGEMGKYGTDKFFERLSAAERRQAQQEGYANVPPEFGDFTAKREKSKPIMATTAGPALVHPDFAEAFQGVFNKNAYRPENPFWKGYDKAGDAIRFGRVALSGFHYGALMEHALGALGPKKALAIPQWTKAGQSLRNNREWRKQAARAGLTFHGPVSEIGSGKGMTLLSRGAKYLESGDGKSNLPAKGLRMMEKGMNYLFEEFQPNLKAVTYEALTQEALEKSRAEGFEPHEEKVRRDIAQLVNDIYGGQQWETQRFFNNPAVRQWMRRAIGYPDWTVSAIKTFADAFTPDLKGAMARKYWLRYGLSYMTLQGFLKFINAGFEQTDPEMSVKGIRWNKDKALQGLIAGDPSKWADFSLPDTPVKIGDTVLNPGRTSYGTKQYGHFGKSAREILNWARHPMAELFSKANPLIQMVVGQVFEATPGADKNYPVRRKYEGGKEVAWDATKPYTVERAISRGKHIIEQITPFSLKPVVEGEYNKLLASPGSLYPVSQGMGLEKSEKYIEKAYRTKDRNLANRIVQTLLDNGKSEEQIVKRFTTVYNRLNPAELEAKKKAKAEKAQARTKKRKVK